MTNGDVFEGKWRGNWRMEWVTSTLHTTSEHGVSSITTADAHTSAASRRLNWRPRWFKWTRPFRRKTKSIFCACAITFSTGLYLVITVKTGVTCLAVTRKYAGETLCTLHSRKRYGYKIPRMKSSRILFSDTVLLCCLNRVLACFNVRRPQFSTL